MKLNIYIVLFTLILTQTKIVLAQNIKDQFLEILNKNLSKNKYILSYDINIATNQNEIIPYYTGSLIIRNGTSLYTKVDKIEYLMNEDLTLIVNNANKKITVYDKQPLNEDEKIEFEFILNNQLKDKLYSYFEGCDSITNSSLQNESIYTLYFIDGEYSKVEYWISKEDKVKSIWIYFNEGDIIYERIDYNYINADEQLSYFDKTKPSFYYNKNNSNEYISSNNYKNYVVIDEK